MSNEILDLSQPEPTSCQPNLASDTDCSIGVTSKVYRTDRRQCESHIANHGPFIHDVNNLLDGDQLLSITGRKVGVVCQVERIQNNFIMFKLWETYSTGGTILGTSLGQASGPIDLFLNYVELIRFINSICF